MKAFFLILAMLSWPVITLAQQVVRTGEHEGFTRIVVPLPPDATWTVQQSERDVTFRVDGLKDGFDLDGVFTPISRERLLDITNHAEGLDLRLGCDCRVAAFTDQGRFAVLDIASPGVIRPTQFIVAVSGPGVQAAKGAMPQRPPKTTRKSAASLETPVLPALSRPTPSEVEMLTLDRVQLRLAQQVGSAATRGLLNPAPGARRPQIDLDALALSAEAAKEPPQPDPLRGLASNMRVTSSMDTPDLVQGPDTLHSVSGLPCPANDAIDIAAWADDRPFHTQTGELHRLLYGEFDQLDPKIALRLAKLYVHFGFGAEALQFLALEDDMARDHRILADIAAIMENGVANARSPLTSLLDCETDAALWAILARADLDSSRSIDPRPALRALNRLPVHLRQFLAPSLSRRFLAHGNADAASAALRSLERLPTPLPSSAKLVLAKIAIGQGRIESGTQTLTDVIDDNQEQSPEALITLVETRLAENQPLDPETARLIEAYAKELQTSHLGPALQRAHVLALAKSSQFDRAFREIGGEAEAKTAIDLRLRLLEELTLTAPDVTFLEHVFGQSPRDIDRLAAQQKFALAHRMVDLGFAEQAQDIVARVPANPVTEERQMLAARIALELSQPMRALAELGEFSTQQANLMRARATQMTGGYADAADLYTQEGRQDEAALATWLARESDNDVLSGNPLFGPALDLARVDIQVGPTIDGMLTRTGALIAESEAARRTLNTLLDSPALQLSAEPGTD